MSARTAMTLVASVCVVLSAAGCSGGDPNQPKLGRVYGTVSYKGKPVEGGHVVFTPSAEKGGATGQTATGEIASDGSYELTTFNTGDGAILGQHIATVTVTEKGYVMPKPKADGTIDYKLPKTESPKKYATADKSPLRYTVTEGKQKIDIELKDKD
jgi:hypothetical protein